MGKSLRNCLRTSIAVVLLTSMAGHAYAGACATPVERMAIRAAAIQQKMMVAAYICNATRQYNRFVLAYRRDLQRSDDVLKDYFRRSDGRRNDAAYHDFKTRLANVASLESSREQRRFCAEASGLFDAALSSRRAELVVFLDGRQTKWERDFPACRVVRTASDNRR